jgi:alkylhydroperoxidase family enzyme
VRIGRRVGLTTEQIEHAGDDTWDGWSDRERALLAATTQLVRERDVDDPTWAALRAHLNEAESIELLMLCGQYDSLATTLMTLRVQPE